MELAKLVGGSYNLSNVANVWLIEYYKTDRAWNNYVSVSPLLVAHEQKDARLTTVDGRTKSVS